MAWEGCKAAVPKRTGITYEMTIPSDIQYPRFLRFKVNCSVVIGGPAEKAYGFNVRSAEALHFVNVNM